MQLHIDTNQKELKAHGTYEFPVNVSYEQLSRYERKSFSWHWHKEIELTILLSGEMNYQINDTVYQLHEGEGIFCNSNVLHTGSSCNEADCIYISTTFHPRFLYGYEGSIMQTKYMNNILEDASLAAIRLSPDIPWQAKVLGGLSSIWELSNHPSSSYELRLHLLLTDIWLLFWENSSGDSSRTEQSVQKNMKRLKTILAYLQEHYKEKITLADIAKQANICQSECCRFFKKHMKESLIEYLHSYRIEQSLPLLKDGQLSVTEIADIVGFSSASYYTKVFREQMGCTPTRYLPR
jgi:AraC-like DNA-binding protein/quercetin dioxygenase-like cupin family protein